jgi:hypothetical protein
MSAPVIPPGETIVQTFRQKFSDVPINAENANAIATTEFLDAAESLTTIFGASPAFCTPPRCLVFLDFILEG